MLRLVQVPTVYYQHPMDGMLGNPWYHGPRSVHCCTPRVCSPRMVYPTLATFLQEAMQDRDRDCNDSATENISCSCHQTNHTTRENKKDQQPEQIPTGSSETASSSCHKNDSSKEETVTEVSIPLNTSSHDPDSNRFHVSLNLSSFNPENIEVKRVDNKLKITARQEVERCGMIFHREIQRSFNLPEDIDSDTLKSKFSTTGLLTVEAERKDSNTCIEQKEEHKEDSDIDGSAEERLTTEDPEGNHEVEESDCMDMEDTEKASE